MGKLDQLFGLLRFAANDQLLVHVGTRGMPGALETTDLRPNLNPWVHRDGVAAAAAPCISRHQENRLRSPARFCDDRVAVRHCPSWIIRPVLAVKTRYLRREGGQSRAGSGGEPRATTVLVHDFVGLLTCSDRLLLVAPELRVEIKPQP